MRYSALMPGIAVPHVRLAGLPRPLLALGLSREGIRFPRVDTPVRVVFLLVSPAERAEEHLRYLAAITRTVSSPDRVSELLDRASVGSGLDWMGLEEQ